MRVEDDHRGWKQFAAGRRLWLGIVLCCAAPSLAHGQEAPLRAVVSLNEYALTSVGDVRAAELTIVRGKEGSSLEVTALAERAERITHERQRALPRSSSTPPAVCLHRATWVWNTDRLIQERALRSTFLAFIREESFDVVFLQLPSADEDSAHGAYVLPASGLLPLIRTLRDMGVSVRALAGDPGFVSPEGQNKLLNLIECVAAYNRGAPEGARFEGIHLDVEPYLLPGFGSPRRTRLLTGFVAMLVRAREAAQRAGLPLGVDIPAWFDESDELTGERFEAEMDSVRRPVLDLLFPLVDECCVMSYKTSAEGSGGVLDAAAEEVGRGGSGGKRVFVALETNGLPDESIAIVRGEPYQGYPLRGAGPDHLLMYGRQDSAIVWFIPAAATDSVVTILQAAGVRDAECAVWTIVRLAPVPATALSFAGSTAAALRNVEMDVRRAFGAERGFAGTAVHDWMNYFKLKFGIRTPGTGTSNP